MSKRPYVYPSVRSSICNMYELSLTYCHIAKNLGNYAFVCLFTGIFVVKYNRLNGSYEGNEVAGFFVFSH